MTEHRFFAALTFCLLAGGTVAVGTELFAGRTRASAQLAQLVTLPEVTVTARREANPFVTLPQVQVTAKRPATRLAGFQAADAPSGPTCARGPFLSSPGMSYI